MALLWDNEDELSETAESDELELVKRLGSAGIERIDANLRKQIASRWYKGARILHDAKTDGGFQTSDETAVQLHLRRLIALVDVNEFEGQGNLYRPCYSEVRKLQ